MGLYHFLNNVWKCSWWLGITIIFSRDVFHFNKLKKFGKVNKVFSQENNVSLKSVLLLLKTLQDTR